MSTAPADLLTIDPLEALRANWLANVTALYSRNPALAAELDRLPFATLPELELARDGALTAKIAADDGRLIHANSRYEPLAEARRVADAQPQPENPTFIVAGAGLGYVWAALEQRFENPVVIVAEPDLGLLKAALCVGNHSAALRAGRLTFITRAERRALHDTLSCMNADVMLGVQFVTLPPAGRCQAAFHAEVRGMIAAYAAYGRMQIMTLVKTARVTCRNIAMNLRDYVRRPGVETLRGAAAGYPAILVAAGPSLARALPMLAALRERAVVIAVQTVYRQLLDAGCVPHFVTSLDYHELSAGFFEGVAESSGATLVAEPKAHWSVFDAFRGPRRLLHAGFAEDLLREAAPRRGALKAGSTVAHLSFYLAEHLGCDPIILIGQDLCYADGLYYPPGLPIEDVWRPELSRFYTPEMKQWERIVRSRPILRTVPDVHGRSTYTDEQLCTYAEQFQADFAATRAQVIHAGQAGMRLSGTTVLTLEDAAHHCTRRLPPDLFAGSDSAANADEAVAAAAAQLRQRATEVGELLRISDQMLELLDRLADLADRPADFNRLLARVDDLRAQIARHDRTYKLVTDAAQLAELRRFRADRQLGDTDVETTESARRRLQRDRAFVADFRDACRFLEQMLPEAIARLEEPA